MKKLIVALLVTGLTTPAFAWHPVVPPIKPIIPHSVGTSGAAGAGAVGGFIGFVAILVGYDLWRRNSCSGDVWGLGGPGFSSASNPYTNVMLTAKDRGLCGGVAHKRRNVVKVRG